MKSAAFYVMLPLLFLGSISISFHLGREYQSVKIYNDLSPVMAELELAVAENGAAVDRTAKLLQARSMFEVQQ